MEIVSPIKIPSIKCLVTDGWGKFFQGDEIVMVKVFCFELLGFGFEGLLVG